MAVSPGVHRLALGMLGSPYDNQAGARGHCPIMF
jgi:hypothetical protein